MKKDIESRLQKIVTENKDLLFLKDNLKSDMDITNLGVNSLLFIKLIVAIENEFDIEFDDNDLDINQLKTFGNIIHYIDNQITDDMNQ